jgi:RNA methyltransferase, TrmH family
MVPLVSDNGLPERWAHLTVIGPKHPTIEHYLGIQNNTKPNPQRLIVLDGLWEIESALNAGLELVALIVSPELFRGNRAIDVLQRAEPSSSRVYAVSPKLANRLSDRDTSDGLAAIAMSRQWQLDDLAPSGPQSLVLVLDGLEVLGNVGTAVRSAQASGAEAVLLTNRRVRMTHPRLIHASMAASLTMPMVDATVPETAAWLARHGYQVVLTDTRAPASYKSLDYGPRVAVVLGSERYGIHRDWDAQAESAISIPMSNEVDSLNVANAATIVLFEVASRHRPVDFGLPGASGVS